MSSILTRTIGRTSPSTRPPSRGSNNSRDFYCRKKEGSDENVPHRILAGTHGKRGPRCRPFWIVAPLARPQAHGEHGNRVVEFHRPGLYGPLASQTPCIDRNAA